MISLENVNPETALLYGKTEEEVQTLTDTDMNPIREDLIGSFLAALPMRQEDVDENGHTETVYDFARADIGLHTYELAPREFNIPEVPFELAFAERKYIQVFYPNQLLIDSEITVTDRDGLDVQSPCCNAGAQGA